MQGPNLLILTNCHGCEFYERKNIFHRCNKLNVPLCTQLIVTKTEYENGTGSSSEYEIPACHIDCPFVKQNELAFHDEKSKKLKEELSLKLKTEITSIFPDYLEYQDYLHKTVGPNLCASFKISHIDFEQLVEFQRNLPDYGLSFSASTQNTIVVSIYKKLEIF